MRVEITFHPMSDMSTENRDAIVRSCLTVREGKTKGIRWTDGAAWTLSFETTNTVAEVLENFEAEGFVAEEFKSISFTNC